MALTLAATGGTGFVGAHLLRLATAQGHRVRALTRRPQPPQDNVDWIAGDLADRTALRTLCDGADAVIHIAGVINARDRAGFDAGNVAGTAAVLDAAAAVRRFVHVSSLAAREPQLSAYGASKAEAERLVSLIDRDWTILRPPAVYGPGDEETLPLFRMVARGVAFLPSRGRASFIEVGDLAACLLALAAAPVRLREIVEVDDGHPGGHAHADVAAAIGDALGRRPRIVHLPSAALAAAAAADTALAKLRGRLPKLSADRARYLAHPDWVARTTPVPGWSPQVCLADGMRQTAAWYRANGRL